MLRLLVDLSLALRWLVPMVCYWLAKCRQSALLELVLKGMALLHCRSERLAKYNQLLRIEEELGNATYAGENWRHISWR